LGLSPGLTIRCSPVERVSSNLSNADAAGELRQLVDFAGQIA
jgi:hypothetical protein